MAVDITRCEVCGVEVKRVAAAGKVNSTVNAIEWGSRCHKVASGVRMVVADWL